MRLAALLAPSLALLAAAQQGRLRDQLVTVNMCWDGKCDASRSTFFDSRTNTTWAFDANNNCRRAAIAPDIYYCVDWYNRRAHYFYGSVYDLEVAEKHCLLRDTIEYYGGCAAFRCEKSTWNPVECTWDTYVPPAWYEGWGYDGHRGPESAGQGA